MTQKFEITSGSLVCSDPCYTTDVWCMSTVNNVRKGTWLADSNIETVGSWGERNVDLTVHHSDFKINEKDWKKSQELLVWTVDSSVSSTVTTIVKLLVLKEFLYMTLVVTSLLTTTIVMEIYGIVLVARLL